ncbi:10977_t:CDS:1, partial [Cetraspora pellucida]
FEKKKRGERYKTTIISRIYVKIDTYCEIYDIEEMPTKEEDTADYIHFLYNPRNKEKLKEVDERIKNHLETHKDEILQTYINMLKSYYV